MHDRKRLQDALEEFVVTVGMVYTAKTKQAAPIDPAELLRVCLSASVIPSDSVPLLRGILADYADLNKMDEDLTDAQAGRLLKEMYQVTGWAGSRIITEAFQQSGFTALTAEEVSLEWSKRPSGFFAQRGALTLYVTPCFTREHHPAHTRADTYWRLAGDAYDIMRKTPGYAERLPVGVVVTTGATVTEPGYTFIEDGHRSVPAHHDFLIPLRQLPQLTDLLDKVFA